MTLTTPCRLMILHFAQIGFTDERTFMFQLSMYRHAELVSASLETLKRVQGDIFDAT